MLRVSLIILFTIGLMIGYASEIAETKGKAIRHNDRGLNYYKQGKLDTAIAEFKRALKINPGLIEARNNLGNAYHDQGNLIAAVTEYQKAIEINPNDAEAHY
ncbi:uncharacterized protein METZ01_LOCUS429750, partial [marine metagenome]